MKQRGFTLIEILVVVVVMSILAAWAAPSMAHWISKYKLKAHTYKIVNDLNERRDEARQRGGVDYEIQDSTDITVTAPTGKSKTIEFDAQGKTTQGGRLVYKVESSKVDGTEYSIIIPAYGTVMAWKN